MHTVTRHIQNLAVTGRRTAKLGIGKDQHLPDCGRKFCIGSAAGGNKGRCRLHIGGALQHHPIQHDILLLLAAPFKHRKRHSLARHSGDCGHHIGGHQRRGQALALLGILARIDRAGDIKRQQQSNAAGRVARCRQQHHGRCQTGAKPYQWPVLGMLAHGSAGGRGVPACSSSTEMLSGLRTKAMRPSRGGRLMVTPLSIRCWHMS